MSVDESAERCVEHLVARGVVEGMTAGQDCPPGTVFWSGRLRQVPSVGVSLTADLGTTFGTDLALSVCSDAESWLEQAAEQVRSHLTTDRLEQWRQVYGQRNYTQHPMLGDADACATYIPGGAAAAETLSGVLIARRLEAGSWLDWDPSISFSGGDQWVVLFSDAPGAVEIGALVEFEGAECSDVAWDWE